MRGGRHILAGLMALAVLTAPLPASANWLTRLLQEAGEAGGKMAAKRGVGALDNAAIHLKGFPPPSPKGATLAATVSQEGHWTFTNLAGERFTVGTPGEMQRIAMVLAPEAAQAKLTLLLTEDAVFANRAHIDLLPKDAELRLIAGKESYRLVRPAMTGAEFRAEIRPNLLLSVGERKLFDEAIWQLARPVSTPKIRVLALEPGGPQSLPPAVKTDPASKQVLTDTIDPKAFADAVRSIPGQTVVISGRVEGRTLHFRPADGSEHSILIDDLIGAAGRTDVNVVVLHARSPRQPGARNWLWQRIEVAGLKQAMGRPTTADFLNAVADGDVPLIVTASERANGRVAISARPMRSETSAPSEPSEGFMSTIVTELTGRVATTGLDMDLTSSERQKELETRIVPGIPSHYQFAYLGFLVIGLLGLPAARSWWGRLWPLERRADYRGAIGYHAARVIRLLAFVLLFLPLIAVPAALTTLTLQLWALVTLPFRVLRALFARRAASNT